MIEASAVWMIRVLLSLADHCSGQRVRRPVATLLSERAGRDAAVLVCYAARIPLASAASVAARSVRSQVNSGSVRPK